MILGKAGPGHLQPGYAVAAVISMAIVLPLAIHFNDQAKDELDRLNALRANSFGLGGPSTISSAIPGFFRPRY